MTPHQNRLDETVLMMGHKICFYEEIWIIIPKLSLLLLLIWSPDSVQTPVLSKGHFQRQQLLCIGKENQMHMTLFMHHIMTHRQSVYSKINVHVKICPPVLGDNLQALASGLSPVEVDKPWYNYFIPSWSAIPCSVWKFLANTLLFNFGNYFFTRKTSCFADLYN